jgi:uncharacterized protein (DUF58 family)
MQFVDAQTLASCRDLVWLSRRIADGVLLGAQHSQRKGAGLEFQQYRSYQPGDPIRHIDWKLFARSDRYFVRGSEQESQMHVCFLLDATASMAQPSLDFPELSKMHYARSWIASLCWLLQRQGDRFSLIVLSDLEIRQVPIGQGEQQQHAIALELSRVQAAGHWPSGSQLRAVWPQFEQPCQVVLVSDFFERADEISHIAARLHAAGRTCLPLQLLIEAEQTFPFSGDLQIRNPEVAGVTQLNAEAQRAQYLAAFQRAQDRLARKFSAWQSPLISATIERPLELSLRRFIAAHSRVA